MRINDAQTYARRNMTEAVVRQQGQYHQERKSFWPGIKIWLLTPSVKPGTARKLANPWSGPWVVRVNDVMVCIQPHPDWSDSQATRVVSIDHLKLYGNEATVRPPDDDANLDMASAEYVKHVDNGGVGPLEPRPPSPGGQHAPARRRVVFPDTSDEEMPDPPRRQPPILRLYPLPGLRDRLEPRELQQERLQQEQEQQEDRRAERGEYYHRRERQELEEQAEARASERRELQRQIDNDRRLEDRRRQDML